MTEIRNFAEAHAALRQFYRKDTTYTLDRMRALMDFLGNPQNELRVIHVAGTSGKTSTAYYVSALLEQSGASVGLTVSPHVDETNERVQLNHTPLPKAEFCRELSEFLGLIAPGGIHPSYFEVMVAFAYWEFVRLGVDYAVVEVGLGGMLDGTNVVSREDKVCIITDIGLDHTEVLGDTLGKIAAQKAGIIQPKNNVFMYCQSDEVMKAVEAVCAEKSATLHLVPQLSSGEKSDLPLFQQRNFHLAEQTAAFVLGRDITESERQEAAKTLVPARMEIIKTNGKSVILDGAHNAQKMQALFESIYEKYPGQPIAVLAGFVQSDAFRLEHNIEELTKNAAHLILTSFYSEKDYPKHSVDPTIVAEMCRKSGYQNAEICEKPAEALKLLLARPEPVLLVAGSFYLLNHIRPLLLKDDSTHRRV